MPSTKAASSRRSAAARRCPRHRPARPRTNSASPRSRPRPAAKQRCSSKNVRPASPRSARRPTTPTSPTSPTSRSPPRRRHPRPRSTPKRLQPPTRRKPRRSPRSRRSRPRTNRHLRSPEHMAEFGAKDVKALRDATGAGMMDAKRALEQNDGDFEEAAKWLREQGIVKSAARTDRENAQGSIAIATNGNAAALVELKSETDFTAKSDNFTALVQRLADAVLADGEGAIAGLSDAVDDLRITTKENIEVGKVARVEAGDGEVLDTYLHRQDGRGVNGVLVVLKGGDADLAHAVSLHIAFAKPKYLRRDEVSADEVAVEREQLEALTRNEGKPEQAIPKIVEGRVNAWIADQTLLEQKMIPDEKEPVEKAIGSASVDRFVQAVIGA